MRHRVGAVAVVASVVLTTSAHVGSPNTFFEGDAGPYAVRVVVRTPGVVPGLAQITVRVRGDSPVNRVTVQPLRWDAGLEGAPPPDTATAIAGQPNLYGAELWLMTPGSYSVHVRVAGPLGAGAVFVPVLAQATTVLPMGLPLEILLAGLAVLLLTGALTIVRAAVRESVLPPGADPRTEGRYRGWVAMIVAGVVLLAAVFGGRIWWNAIDGALRDRVYRPLETESSLREEASGPVLRFTIVDEAWRDRRWTPLIPDHGKLMHMFVMRDDGAAFAHLHPVAVDSNTFDVPLPPLPAGKYRIYGDVVHESGYAQTLTDTIDVEGVNLVRTTARDSARPSADADPDDSWWTSPATGGVTATLADGSIMSWHRHQAPLRAGEELELRFTVAPPEGSATGLEPYMGMVSHAAVERADGSVFVHLHPVGSIAVAAQRMFEEREARRSGAAIPHPTPAGAGHPEVGAEISFPYEFPRAGRYRLWVQVKRHGKVLTGAFVAEVQS